MEMVKTEIQENIEKRLQHLLGIFGVSAQINSVFQDQTLRIEAKTTNDDLFVGKTADPLLALQHLLRVLFKKELTEQAVSLVLNIGDFQDRQKNQLEELATEAVGKALSTNQPVALRPMSSFERRVVHLVLADHPDVTSESEGDSHNRHIVIRPK